MELGPKSSRRVTPGSHAEGGSIELLEGWIDRICNKDGKMVAGYDTCHCLELIYRFTAFMHFYTVVC